MVSSYSNLNESYIEVHSYILNPMADIKDSIVSRRIESLIIINDGSQIVVAEKYLYNIDADQQSDILDVKRFNIGNGNFSIRVEIVDLDDAEYYYSFSDEVTIDYPIGQANQSSLFLGFSSENQNQSLIKQNIAIEPMVFDFCRNQTELVLYNEFYHLDKVESDLYSSIYMYKLMGEADGIEVKKKFKKINKQAFSPIIEVIPIDDLTSGEYKIEISVIDRQKEILFSKAAEFTISNVKQDLAVETGYNSDYENAWVQDMTQEELEYGIKAIFPGLPVMSAEMYNYVLSSKDINVKKYFLFKYWVDQAPDSPELVYNKYMTIAKAVDRTYKNHLGHGFESDRGYIFLKYGKPNNVVEVEDEPSAPPYEIWIYNYLEQTKQTEVKFLFYNKSLVTNDYSLLHSTCRGELNNSRWEVQLYGNDPNAAVGNTIDARSVSDGFNRRARHVITK